MCLVGGVVVRIRDGWLACLVFFFSFLFFDVGQVFGDFLGGVFLSAKGLELQERDYEILRLVYRFRFCLGRHVQVLCGFSGARASDRRLKLLVEAG